MTKHTETVPCRVPFCQECLANIKRLKEEADHMRNPSATQGEEELLDRHASKVISALYERHDALHGSWEPVYGKKYYIGDTCNACGTHFRGLEDDIKLLFKHEAKALLEQELTKARLDEANKALQLEYNTGTDTGFTEGMQSRIATLTTQLKKGK